MTIDDQSLQLELLNGAGMVVEFCFIAYMVRYLRKEAIRRDLKLIDWINFRLPPSMNFAISVVVFDAGVWLRSLTIWSWRRFERAGQFNRLELTALSIGAAMIVLGALCKVRAITKPDYGNEPWILTAVATALFVCLTLLSR